MMNHLNEEQLVLYYYGEPDGSAGVEEHLAGCDACRAEYHSLQRVLNTVDSFPVPERAPDYEMRLWRALAPQVGRRARMDWRAWLAPRRWAVAGAMAVLLIGAFVAGRSSRTSAPTAAPAVANAGPVRERVLLVAVGDHLERSQMVLVELANGDARGARASGQLDISYEQQTAGDLLEANRLFRQTATSAGDLPIASLLEDLERVLIEIAHSPSSLNERQLEDLRGQIEERGILFKVKIFGSRVRDRIAVPAPAGSKTDTL